QNLSGQRFLYVSWRTSGLVVEIDDAGCDIAQQRDIYLAVEINVLDELRDKEIVRLIRQPDQRRIPHAPGVAAFVGHVPRIHGIASTAGSGSLRERAKTHACCRL